MTEGMTQLAGWGLNVRAACKLREPESPEQVVAWLDRGGTIARGVGRSYGDPALNAGGQVIGMQKLDRYLAFDAQTGVLTCEAGVTLAQIIRDFAPRGWFPMITPGDCLSQLDSLGLDDETKRLFLAENAVRVFRL